jgi:quercetin dioxygenase-like cupin family protein
VTSDLTQATRQSDASDPSFRAKQADAFSSLPLLRKFGQRSEKSLFAFVGFVTALDWRGFKMKSLLYAPMVLLVSSLNAQAPEPARLPGEPHHHLKIENEFVRVYYVEVPPHENTQLHQHDHDYIYVSVGPADVVNAVLDKPEVHLVLRDGEIHFTRGGFAHVARNLADTPFRNVTIELLKPQGEAHNECGFVIPGQGAAICDPPFTQDWTDTQFETKEARLDLVWLFRSGKHKETDSKLAFLVVGLSSPHVKLNAKGKLPKILREGEMEWFDPGSEVQFSSEGCEMAQFLMLTFKDSATPASH